MSRLHAYGRDELSYGTGSAPSSLPGISARPPSKGFQQGVPPRTPQGAPQLLPSLNSSWSTSIGGESLQNLPDSFSSRGSQSARVPPGKELGSAMTPRATSGMHVPMSPPGSGLARSDSWDLLKWKEECAVESARILKERRRRGPGGPKPSPYGPKTGSSKTSRLQRLAQVAETQLKAQKKQEVTIDMHLDQFGISRNQSVEVANRKHQAVLAQKARERRQKEREVSRQCRIEANEWRQTLSQTTKQPVNVVQEEEQEVVEVVEVATKSTKEPESQERDVRVSRMLDKLDSRKLTMWERFRKSQTQRLSALEEVEVEDLNEAEPQDVPKDSGRSVKIDVGDGPDGPEFAGNAASVTIANNFMNLMTSARRSVKPKGTLESRISILVKNQKLKKKTEKIKKQYEARKARFILLPKFEQDAMRQAFSHYDSDGSETLNVTELNSCLAELGLRGKNGEERASVAQTCNQINQQLKEEEAENNEMDDDGNAMQSLEIDIYVLVVELLPQIRERLQDSRRSVLLQSFTQYDTGGVGRLGVEECRNVAKGMDLEPSVINQVIEEFVPGATAKDKIDFDVFQRLISRLHEITDRNYRKKEREIKEKAKLTTHIFQKFRRELIPLYNSFQEFDSDKSGQLDAEEVTAMMKEFGLLPRTPAEREELENLIRNADADGEAGLDFREFLDLVSQIRRKCMQKTHDVTQAFFDRHDKDHSGQLSVAEVSAVLADLNLTPKTHEEQHEIRILIQDVDEDGSGDLNFQEFQMLSQRVVERLMMLNLEAGKKLALELGFSLTELKELRAVFDQLDSDGSNAIDLAEARQALVVLKRDIPADQLRQVWTRIDVDGSDELDFGEFLRLMSILNDSNSSLSAGKRRVESLMYVELETLRKILEIFKLGKAYVLGLSTEDCIQTCADCLGVEKCDQLSSAVGANTVDELLAVAKRKASKSY